MHVIEHIFMGYDYLHTMCTYSLGMSTQRHVVIFVVCVF